MSILNVNQIQPVGGGNTITVSASDISASGATITATSFVGPLTGAVTGNVTGNLTGAVTGNVTGNLTGNVTGNVTSSSTSTFSSGINVTGGRVLVGTTNAGSNGTADDLVVANNSSASDQAGISIRGGTSGRSQIFFSDGTSGQDEYRGMLRYDHSENSMQFRTDAAERLRIDSAGRLLCGTSSGSGEPIAAFQGRSNDANDSGIVAITRTGTNPSGSIGELRFATGSDFNKYYAMIICQSDGSTTSTSLPGVLRFSTTASGSTSPTERMRIHSGGVVSIPNGIELGSGVDATAANTLDDYEEGTFDPTITANSGGSITLNSGYNTLSYTKIGRIVHISGQIRVSSVSSPVGNTNITNLPFTAQSTTEQGRAGANCFYYDASAGSGNYYRAVPIHVTEGTTTLKILNLHSFGGITVAANDEIAFAFSYITP